jgi:sRNA-binding carbon storage regulator CsrA
MSEHEKTDDDTRADEAYQAERLSSRKGLMPALEIPEGNNLVALTRYKGQTVHIGRTVRLRVEWVGNDPKGYPQTRLIITKPINVSVRRGELLPRDTLSVEKELEEITHSASSPLEVEEGHTHLKLGLKVGDTVKVGDALLRVAKLRDSHVSLDFVAPREVPIVKQKGE